MITKFIIVLSCVASIYTHTFSSTNNNLRHETRETEHEKDQYNINSGVKNFQNNQFKKDEETFDFNPLSKPFTTLEKNQENNSSKRTKIKHEKQDSKTDIEIQKQHSEADLDDSPDEKFLSRDKIFAKLVENYQHEFQGMEDWLKQNIHRDVKNLEEKENNPEVGFGGNPQGDPKRILFGNMTTYVNKAINQAKQKLKQKGRIYANNPPYVIYRIPKTPIIFELKYIEKASTLTTQGTSTGLHYFKALYCYTQYKFEDIRYHYEVQIRPMDLFAIRKSLTVVLENSRVWMPVAVKNNIMTIQRFEFVLPNVSIKCADNSFINYILNDIIIDKYYPEIKQKLAKIASRDTKILLDSHLEDAQ